MYRRGKVAQGARDVCAVCDGASPGDRHRRSNPDVSQTWYEQGFGRALEALAGSFELLAARGLPTVDDPNVAANRYVGLLLWIPVNRAMFSGGTTYTPAELEAFADAAVDVFLRAYGSLPRSSKGSALRR